MNRRDQLLRDVRDLLASIRDRGEDLPAFAVRLLANLDRHLAEPEPLTISTDDDAWARARRSTRPERLDS